MKTWYRQFEAADPVVQTALLRPKLTVDMQDLVAFLRAGMADYQPPN